MSSIKSVFHPTDFSHPSGIAFCHALKIALCNRSTFEILHVDSDEPHGPHWSDFPQVRETLVDWKLLKKGSPREAVDRELGLDVRKVELGGKNSLAAMCRYLEQKPAELIVLSTEGRDGPSRWLHPSISERLAQRSSIPALFVHKGARGFVNEDTGALQLSRVLVPVDHSPEPAAAISAACSLVESLGASGVTLEALFVGEAATRPHVELTGGSACTLELSTREDAPVDAIVAAAQASAADLIVMATAGHDGFLDALRGSTTEQVLRHSPCAVLAVPAA